MTALTKILEFLFGRKYYANIINTRGTNKFEVSCYIYSSEEEADNYRKDLETNMSYMFVERISFRSRMDYPIVNRASRM